MESKSPLLGMTLVGALAAVAAMWMRAPHASTASTTDASKGDEEAKPAPEVWGGPELLTASLGDLDEDAKKQHTLELLIATLPDPVDSHLDWAFDQQLDSLRRAHETAGYVVEGFWLPWSVDPELDEPVKRALRREHPGVILFRRKATGGEDAELRLLYLVGEIPTSGVHKQALGAALDEREQLRDTYGCVSTTSAECGDRLRIVGPVFSGTSQSLRRLLEGWIQGSEDRCADVITGAATSAANEAVLGGSGGGRTGENAQLVTDGGCLQAVRGDDKIRFAATIHADETLLAVLSAQPGSAGATNACPDGDPDSIRCRLGIPRSQIAILQESSTQYGASFTTEQEKQEQTTADTAKHAAPDAIDGFLRIPFPMNISSLRAAYAREWSADPTPQAGPRVELDLAERERAGEIPHALSPLSTAATDLAMAEIARALDSRHVRMVVIFATDVRDKLFLGREIAKRLPDVQLVTTESNLLYLRSDLNDALRGMLVLSTYPLIVRAGEWRPQTTGIPSQQLIFASDGAEGVYNAALLQLGMGSAVADYASPFPPKDGRETPTSVRPPVWITCVGKSAMLPVAMREGSTVSPLYPTAIEVKAAVSACRDEGAMSLLSVGLTLVLGLAILVASVRVFLTMWPKRSLSMSMLGRIAKEPAKGVADAFDVRRITYALHYEIYGAIGMLALLELFLPHATILCCLAKLPSTIDHVAARWAWLSAAFLAVGIAALLLSLGRVGWILAKYGQRGLAYALALFRVNKSDGAMWILEIVLRAVVVIAAIAFAVVSTWFSFQIRALAKDAETFEVFYQRGILVGEGVSPLLPLFVGGIALTAWCLWHLRRVRLLCRELPFEVGTQDLTPGQAETIAEVRTRLSNVVPNRWGVLVGAIVGIFIFWLVGAFENSLESLAGEVVTVARPEHTLASFEFLFRAAVVVLLSTTATAAYRLVVSWRALQACLAANDDERALAALERLRKRYGLATTLDLWRPAPREDLGPLVQRTWRRLIGRSSADAVALVEEIASVRKHLEATERPDSVSRAELVKRLRHVLPVQESIDDRQPPRAKDEAPTALATWIAAAHDALAIELVDWVEWTIRHIRTLALFLLVSLTLTTVLLYCYPFHPQSLFRVTFLFVFAGVVGGLLYVIAQMNRNPVLSRITGTEPGQLTWDRTLVTNLLLFGILPLLTIASSQLPALRGSLFSWVDPLLRSLTQSQ